MPNNEEGVEVSDTRNDDSSNAAGTHKKYFTIAIP
jgi:hypothetical protein